MELTNKDKKKIDEDTRKVAFRIRAEASEYAHLYEQTYLQRLIERIQEQIEVREYVHNNGKEQ